VRIPIEATAHEPIKQAGYISATSAFHAQAHLRSAAGPYICAGSFVLARFLPAFATIEGGCAYCVRVQNRCNIAGSLLFGVPIILTLSDEATSIEQPAKCLFRLPMRSNS
jgi:hypothetical protein